MLKSNGATRNRRIQQMIQHFINIDKWEPIKVTSDCLFQNSGLRIHTIQQGMIIRTLIYTVKHFQQSNCDMPLYTHSPISSGTSVMPQFPRSRKIASSPRQCFRWRKCSDMMRHGMND